ncbi:MAG: copper homeostasis protein [Arenicella sp.]|jgi:copper homeostasis protein
MDFELCIDSIEEALTAKEFGFKRVELCSGLEVGGLTPSYGLISSCVDVQGAEVHVIIRPNAGGFVYSNVAFELMQKDIMGVAAAKAAGVVFGIMNEENRIDYQKNSGLVQLAKSQDLECTFHRAIDLSSDWQSDLDDLIEIGFDRVLSSGGASRAIDGIDRLAEMKEHAAGRIQIMAGAGVNANNALKLAKAKVDALHFTARTTNSKKDNFGFGSSIQIDSQKIEDVLRHF